MLVSPSLGSQEKVSPLTCGPAGVKCHIFNGKVKRCFSHSGSQSKLTPRGESVTRKYRRWVERAGGKVEGGGHLALKHGRGSPVTLVVVGGGGLGYGGLVIHLYYTPAFQERLFFFSLIIYFYVHPKPMCPHLNKDISLKLP